MSFTPPPPQLLLVIFGSCALFSNAQAQTRPLAAGGYHSDAGVYGTALVPTEGFNLQIVARDAGTIELAPRTRGAAHNWFAGLFNSLPVGEQTTFAIDMTGQDTKNKADVSKWKGLRPLLSYADPSRPESYFSYVRRADGVWESDDPVASGARREAGDGAVPLQNVMPPALASAFLNKEKRPNPAHASNTKAPRTVEVQTWSAWRELTDVEAQTETNRFLIRESFALPYATIAMRVPYTPLLHQRLIERLEAARPRHLWVDRLGKTPGGHELTVLRVEEEDARAVENKRKPTILVLAREHATEHAGSWAAYGLLISLLEETPAGREMRAAANWLVVPLQDPDGAAASVFERMTESFGPGNDERPPEAWLYLRYLRDWADEGRTLDLAVSIHNVESDEAVNLSTPFTDNKYIEATDYLNEGMFPFVRKAGFLEAGAADAGHIGGSPWRLYGWAGSFLGALPVAYEVNDRYPRNRLSLWQLQHLGARMGLAMARWSSSERGQTWHDGARRALVKRGRARDEARDGKPAPKPGTFTEQYELVTKGF